MSKDPVSYEINLDNVEVFSRNAINVTVKTMITKGHFAYNEEETESGYMYTNLLSLKRITSYPELSELYSRLENGRGELTDEERKHHYTSLLNSLKASANCIKNLENTSGLLKEFPSDISVQEDVIEFLESIKTINSRAREIGTISANAVLMLLNRSTYDQIKGSIDNDYKNYSNEIASSIDNDLIRNGVVVRKNNEVKILKDKSSLLEWAENNGLSGEQIEFAINMVDQATGTGWSTMPTSFHCKKIDDLAPVSVGSNDYANEPTSFIDVTDDGKVVWSTNFRSDTMMAGASGVPKNYSNTSLSTLSCDITNLRKDHFTPGLPSSGPIKLHAQLSFLKPEILTPSVPSSIVTHGPDNIESHIKEYARLKIRGACDIRSVINLFMCSDELLRDHILAQLHTDERFSTKEGLINTFKEAVKNLHPEIEKPGKILLSLLEIQNTTGFKEEFDNIFVQTFSKLSPSKQEESKEYLIQVINTESARGSQGLKKRFSILKALNLILSDQEKIRYNLDDKINEMKDDIQTLHLKKISLACSEGNDSIKKELHKTFKYFQQLYGEDSKKEFAILRKNILSDMMDINQAINLISELRKFEEEKQIKPVEFNVSNIANIAKNPVKYGIRDYDLPEITSKILSLFKTAYGDEVELDPTEFILHTAKEKGFRVKSGLFGLFSLSPSSTSDILANDPGLLLNLEFKPIAKTLKQSKSSDMILEEPIAKTLIKDSLTLHQQRLSSQNIQSQGKHRKTKPRSLSL